MKHLRRLGTLKTMRNFLLMQKQIGEMFMFFHEEETVLTIQLTTRQQSLGKKFKLVPEIFPASF